MSRCKTVSFFYTLIPLRSWRAFLVRRHVESCAHCQASLASRAETRPLFVQERTLDIGRTLWAAVEPGLRDGTIDPTRTVGRRAAAGFRPRRWAFAAALLLVLVTGYWLLKDFRPETVSAADGTPARFELAYVRVDGRPADVVIYQPQKSDMIIVWAGKN
jgi:hypothetical protein